MARLKTSQSGNRGNTKSKQNNKAWHKQFELSTHHHVRDKLSWIIPRTTAGQKGLQVDKELVSLSAGACDIKDLGTVTNRKGRSRVFAHDINHSIKIVIQFL